MNKNQWIVCVLFFLLVSLNALAKPLAQLKSQGAELRVTEQFIEIRDQQRALIKLTGFNFNYFPLRHWRVEEATSNHIQLTGSLPADVEYYHTAFDTEPREISVTISAVEGGFRFYANPSWGNQVGLELDYLGDHFFGLSAPLQPDNRLSPDLTGASVDVDVTADGATFFENYASAFSAFYMSSQGYGAFFDSFASGRYQFAINGKNYIHHNTGTLDWYVFIGADGTAIHKHYFKLIGHPKPVPAWAMGPVGWRDQNNGGAKEIIDDVARLTEMKIPFTSWFVDRPYSDGAHAWSKMNFSKGFSDPKNWIATLNEKFHLEFMTWVSPATFGDEVFNRHLQGKFSYIDLSDEMSVTAYQQRLRTLQHEIGVKGHKIDRADEALPLHESWADGTPTQQRHNKYAYLMAKAHHEVLEQTWPADNVTFARAAIHRSQPYLSAIWGGDPRTTFDGMRANFANAMRSAFMGFPVWGTDVGGYQGEGFIPEDLYTRWLQAGSLSGLFEIKLDGAGGDGKDRMPWQYNEDFQARFRKICEDRMQFLPYLYSLANTSETTGVLMKPLAYVHLHDKNTWDVWDQFYLGDAILAAPVFDQNKIRKLYLPEGTWRNFDKPAETFKGGKTIELPVTLDSLPRFIKQNSIFITGDFPLGNREVWKPDGGELKVHVNPGLSGDEVEFIYKDLVDKFQKRIRAARNGNNLEIAVPSLATTTELTVYLNNAPKQITVAGKLVKADYDAVQATLKIKLPELTSAIVRIAL